MAATAGGGGGPCFSIRGYAARARAGAADEGGRCWPLGGPPEPLPPMEVRRFRWWADEAALADDMDDGEEERRNAAMRRKRSVVELFAAVPRVAGDDGRKVKRKLDKGKQPAGAQAKKGPKKDKAPAEIAASARKKDGWFAFVMQTMRKWWHRVGVPTSLGRGPADVPSTLS